MSVFAALESGVSNEIDKLYGDPTQIERTIKGNLLAGAADPEWTVLEVIGIIDVNPVTVTVQDEGSRDGMRPHLAGEKFHVSYDLSLFQSAALYPKQGDLITAPERSDIPKLRVTRADPDGIGRIVCVCEKA